MNPPLLQMPGVLTCTGAIPPLGLAYVAAALRRAGIPVQVVDAAGEAPQRRRTVETAVGPLLRTGLDLREVACRLAPEVRVVGITHLFLHEWPMVRDLVREIKVLRPDVRVVLGGENATSFWPWIFRQSRDVDYCVLGEGERTAVALVREILSGRDPQGLDGVVSPGSSTARVPSPRTKEPDALPWPAWDLFPMEGYLAAPDGFGVNRGRAMPLLATRGCPFQCTFCSSEAMWTTLYRTRDPREVVAEMKHYVERYRVRNFNFCDLTAVIRRDWILEFCRRLQAERLEVTWQLPSGTRSEALDEEVLAALHRAGCRNLTYAPESGSERMLRRLKKRVRLDRMLDSLRAARRVGIVSRVNVIVGHPDEEPTDLWESCKLLLRCASAGCHDAAVMIFAPYPGSEDFRRLLAEGRLQVDDRYCYTALARGGAMRTTFNHRMGRRFLLAAQLGLLAAFYAAAFARRPDRIAGTLRSLLTGREETQLDQFLRTRRARS